MKKLSVLSFFAVIALCLAFVAGAGEPAAESLTFEQQMEVLDWMGFETPEWVVGPLEQSFEHPTCDQIMGRPECNYKLVGCCCVSQNGLCPTACL